MREPHRPQNARRELAGLEPNERKEGRRGSGWPRLREQAADYRQTKLVVDVEVWVELGTHKRTNSFRSVRKERQRAGKRSKKERRAWCAMADWEFEARKTKEKPRERRRAKA